MVAGMSKCKAKRARMWTVVSNTLSSHITVLRAKGTSALVRFITGWDFDERFIFWILTVSLILSESEFVVIANF